MDKSDVSLKDLLTLIRPRSTIIFGRHPLVSLHAFLEGFMFARRNKHPKETEWLQDFQRWVAFRFQVFSSVGWCSILQLYTTSEAQELPLFWKCLDEFETSGGKLPGLDDEFAHEQLATHLIDTLAFRGLVEHSRIAESVDAVKEELVKTHLNGGILKPEGGK